MSKRIAAWEKHYPWVAAAGLGTSRTGSRARATTRAGDRLRDRARELSRAADACVAALVRKTEVLWHLLDCVQAATS
jgi:pyrroloquinoline-quinone synthase